MKNLFIFIGIAVIAGLIGFQLISNKHKINEKNKPIDHSNAKTAVTVATVTATVLSSEMNKTGTLIPFDEADIVASMPGRVTNVNFMLGGHVGQGATVANITVGTKNVSLDDAQTSVHKLESDYKTYQELLAGDGTTKSRVKDIKLSLDNARHQVEQLKVQISDYRVIAPISGIVVLKNTVAGEYVGPGSILGKIVDVSRLKVQVNVSEAEVYKLHTGQYTKVTSDIYPNQAFNGRVSFISPQGDSSHNYPVEVTIANSSQYPLKAGTFAFADFAANTTEKILEIPRAALIQSIKNPSVYVYSGGIVALRAIEIGRITDDKVEVKSGLLEGEKVVTTGQINLDNGTKVEVIN